MKIYSPYYMGKITVGSNVVIGADVIIMYNVNIGDNCIIAAGSVVTKDILTGTVADRVQGKTVETLERFISKRKPELLRMPKKGNDIEHLVRYYWERSQEEGA